MGRPEPRSWIRRDPSLTERAGPPLWVVAPAIAVFAVLAWSGWFVHVASDEGWHGLRWLALLRGPATLPCCLAIAAAAAVAQVRRPLVPTRVLLFLGLDTLLGWWTWLEAAPVIAGIANPRSLAFVDPADRLLFEASLAGEVLGFALAWAVCHWLLARWLLGPIHVLAIPALLLCLVLVPIDSALLVQVLPALNGAQDFEHAIKMGYAPGFTALLVGIVALVTRRRPSPARTWWPWRRWWAAR